MPPSRGVGSAGDTENEAHIFCWFLQACTCLLSIERVICELKAERKVERRATRSLVGHRGVTVRVMHLQVSKG